MQQANFLSGEMCDRFRQLGADVSDVRVARGMGEPALVINLEGNREQVVGMGGRPTRSCRRGKLPQAHVEESEEGDESDDDESYLDLPLA
jgi:hypothetical protein